VICKTSAIIFVKESTQYFVLVEYVAFVPVFELSCAQGTFVRVFRSMLQHVTKVALIDAVLVVVVLGNCAYIYTCIFQWSKGDSVCRKNPKYVILKYCKYFTYSVEMLYQIHGIKLIKKDCESFAKEYLLRIVTLLQIKPLHSSDSCAYMMHSWQFWYFSENIEGWHLVSEKKSDLKWTPFCTTHTCYCYIRVYSITCTSSHRLKSFIK